MGENCARDGGCRWDGDGESRDCAEEVGDHFHDANAHLRAVEGWRVPCGLEADPCKLMLEEVEAFPKDCLVGEGGVDDPGPDEASAMDKLENLVGG